MCPFCDRSNPRSIRNQSLTKERQECLLCGMPNLPCVCWEAMRTGKSGLSGECIESDPIVQKSLTIMIIAGEFGIMIVSLLTMIIIHKCMITITT